MAEETSTEIVAIGKPELGLPPILLGPDTPAVGAQVESFYNSVAEIFDRWVTRRSSKNTQRAYRADVMAFVGFMEFWNSAGRKKRPAS